MCSTFGAEGDGDARALGRCKVMAKLLRSHFSEQGPAGLAWARSRGGSLGEVPVAELPTSPAAPEAKLGRECPFMFNSEGTNPFIILTFYGLR